MRCRVAALLAIGLVAAASQGRAQVTTLRNLAFGTITSGTTTAVAPTSVSAAEWRIQGFLGLGASFRLTLPTTLTGPGPALAITFSPTSGIYRVNNPNPVGGTTFNPNNAVPLPPFLRSTIYVFLGGSVSPPLNQTPGTYTGTVVLTSSGII